MKRIVFSALVFLVSAGLYAQSQIVAALPEYWEHPTGKYEVEVDNDHFLPNHTVFYPKDLNAFPEEDTLPVLVMSGPGWDATSSAFRAFFTEVASHGYLMIVDGVLTEETVNTGILPKNTKEDMEAGINWAFNENERHESIFFGKIDTGNVCLMGQSAGGLQALDLMNDPRVTLLNLFNSGIFVKKEGSPFNSMSRDKNEAFANMNKPIAYFVGGTDMARENAEDDFKYIENVPVVVAVRDIPGDAHAGTFRENNGGAFAVAAVHWLDWNTKGDLEAAKYFVGKDCGLSQDPLWIDVKKKNID